MMFPGWGMTGWVMAGYGLITVVLIAAVIALIASTATRGQRRTRLQAPRLRSLPNATNGERSTTTNTSAA